MNIDQEFKSLIPALTSEEYKQLEQNIINEGCRDALVTWNDTLIDGHNRYEICTKNNIPFTTIPKEFENREEVIEWIIRNQFGRRNMSDYSKGILALKLEKVMSEQAKRNQKLSGEQFGKGMPNSAQPIKPIVVTKELAKIAGIGNNNMKRIKIIEREASQEQKEALVKETKTINKVYHELGHGLPKKKVIEANEETIEEGTKICTVCGIEKSINEFYEGKGKCKECYSIGKVKVIKDFMGNVYKSNKEVDQLAKEHMEDIARDMYDNNKVIVITSDDLVMDLQSFTDAFIRNVNRSVDEYDITMTQENSKKITAILLTVEEAVEKIKGCFINE